MGLAGVRYFESLNALSWPKILRTNKPTMESLGGIFSTTYTSQWTNILGLALVKVDKISNVTILAPQVYHCTCMNTFQWTYMLQRIHM